MMIPVEHITNSQIKSKAYMLQSSYVIIVMHTCMLKEL